MAVLYNKRQIESAIQNTARVIENDLKGNTYTSDNPFICICVLNGAMYFFTQLTQCLKHTVIGIDTIGVKSYEKQEQSTIDYYKQLKTVIKNKDVLIVEDIIDSGNTIKFILDTVKKEHPKSIKIVTLVNRKESNVLNELHKLYNDVSFYKCLDINNEWVYGYGLDLDGVSRELTMICSK